MTSLVEKYRPGVFEDVVGQELAVEYLRKRVVDGHTQSIMLVGPPGVGKTTLARIYASALHCERPRPSPCGKCGPCRAFQSGQGDFHLMEFNGAHHNDHGTAAFVASLGRSVPWGRYGFFVDEVHGLKDSAADALLRAVESPGEGAFFIFATSDPSAVRPALMSRCVKLDLRLISPDRAFRLLADICAEEGVTFEPPALHMLVDLGGGSPRELIKLLDHVSSFGHVTPELVANVCALNWTAALLAYVRGLLSADIAAQEEAVRSWPMNPPGKADAIRQFLLYLHNFEVVTPRLSDVVNAAFHQIGAEDRRPVVAGLSARAAGSGMTLDSYVLDLLAFWNCDRSAFSDESGLRVHLRRFNGLVNPGPAPFIVEEAVSETRSARPYRARSAMGRRPAKGHGPAEMPAEPSPEHLSIAQVEGLYQAASFLPQEYGLLFNAYIALNHGLLGSTGERGAAQLVSGLTHELGIRIRRWAGQNDGFHWAYVNGSDATGPVTKIALHIPLVHGDRAVKWIGRRLADWRGDGACSDGAWSIAFDEVQNAQAANSTPSQVKRHWRIVGRLWSGVDPGVLHWAANGARVPLIDLLQVRRQERRPAGNLRDLRRWGTSSSLGPEARKRAEAEAMGFLSAFRDCAWDNLTTGWELDEFRDRRAERSRRQDEELRATAEWPGNSDLEAIRRNEALRQLQSSYPAAPHGRRRSWVGWWT